MKSVLNGISTIIFDLGGVVLDLDPDLTAAEFARLSKISPAGVFEIFYNSEWAPAFEKGEINADAFRKQIRKALKIDSSDHEIDVAWNAMLLEIPFERLSLLSGLRQRFDTMVLSNTNEIHIKEFARKVSAVSRSETIHDHFNKIYFSNELEMRKPEPEIYKFVIETNNLEPGSTLFIDDMLPNIEAASKFGIKTIHLTDQADLFRIFD